MKTSQSEVQSISENGVGFTLDGHHHGMTWAELKAAADLEVQGGSEAVSTYRRILKQACNMAVGSSKRWVVVTSDDGGVTWFPQVRTLGGEPSIYPVTKVPSMIEAETAARQLRQDLAKRGYEILS